MNISTALIIGTKKLRAKKILSLSASLDAEILLSFVLKKNKEYLFAYPEKKISKVQEKKFIQCIQKRLRYCPIAYIIGVKEFYGRDFIVNKNVLIPRPETESLVEEIVEYFYNLEPSTYNLSIADIGTGSGCIAVTLAKELNNILPLTPHPSPRRGEGGHGPGEGVIIKYDPSSPPLIKGRKIKIYATDISAQALVVAKKNAKIYKTKILFSRGNLLEPIKDKKIDIIIANLPYLNPKDKNEYKKILSHEPKKSLYAKNDGLEYYNNLFHQISEYKIFPLMIVCEIMPRQRKNLKKIAQEFVPNYSTKFFNYTAIVTKNTYTE